MANDILSTPLVWMTVTLTAYEAGFWLHRRLKEPVLVPPMLLSLTILIMVLLAADVNYQQYFKANAFIHFLLGTDVTQRVVFAIGHMPFLRPSSSTSFLMRND
ncbi:MAG: LrgB family protein [Agitococcus sp.]